MSDGVFKLGGLDVEVKSGLCKILGTETIAGSTLTMDKVIKNLKTLNYSLEQLVLGASVDPSRAIEAHDIGLLLPGKKADFITLDKSLQVKETFVDGKEVI